MTSGVQKRLAEPFHTLACVPGIQAKILADPHAKFWHAAEIGKTLPCATAVHNTLTLGSSGNPFHTAERNGVL